MNTPDCVRLLLLRFLALSLVLAGATSHSAVAARSAAPQVLVAASGTSVTALQVQPAPGVTTLRFLTDGRLRPPSAARSQDRFQVLMPGVDLSPVAGSWGIGTPEVQEVRVSPGDGEGITVTAAPGVLCELSLFAAGLEVSCRMPPEPSPQERGEQEPARREPNPRRTRLKRPRNG